MAVHVIDIVDPSGCRKGAWPGPAIAGKQLCRKRQKKAELIFRFLMKKRSFIQSSFLDRQGGGDYQKSTVIPGAGAPLIFSRGNGMPIYEFFCRPCNTIFSFYSSRVNTSKVPSCPKCGKKLQRQMSIFATIGRAREEDDSPLPDMDESRLEGVLGELAKEAENVKEDDPRQMAQIMRRFSEKTGLHLGDSMEEAIARLEAGEDPDKIEEELGELFEGEDPLATMKKKAKISKSPAPFRDEVLYEL